MKEGKELIQLKRPGYHRKSFSIMKKSQGKWSVVKTDQTKVLNDCYRRGELGFEDCEKQFQEIIAKIYETRDKDLNSSLSSNMRLMEEYYAYKYLRKSRKRRLAGSTPAGALNDLRRAIVSLGQLDMTICPIDKMQEHVDLFFEGYESNGPHKKAVTRVNALLKYCGRPQLDRLETLPDTFSEVKNVSSEEFSDIAQELEGLDRILASIAYHSGLRIGEIFALQKAKVRPISGGIVLNVDRQMYRDFTYDLPKRRKIRRAFANSQCADDLKAWLDVSEVERNQIRNRRFSKIISNACNNANTFHNISFKDLRHCYAINLLNRGATISQVAQNLGNSEQVCRNHYVGYVMTNDGIEMMAKIVGSS